MSCETWIPWLVRAADDRLDGLARVERERLLAHLTSCPACRSAVDEQRAVRTALQAREDAPLPLGFATRVRARVLAERAEPGWLDVVRWRTWTCRLAPVATALLIVGLATGPADPLDTAEHVAGDLAERAAFGPGAPSTLPAFALLGEANVSGGGCSVVAASTEDIGTNGCSKGRA